MASMPYSMQPPGGGGGGIYSQASLHGSHSNGSVGPLIVVLSVIAILGVVAGMIGRLCAGRRFRRDSENDFEGWIERKCATCIDGRLESGGGGGGAAEVPVAKPAENPEAPPAKPEEGGGGGAEGG